MSNITLYLGNKNKSSWSLRAWLMLLQTGADFEAIFIQLGQPDTKEKITKLSPSAKIPVLQYNDQIVWDSLAIGEYLAEIFPRAQLWPTDLNVRAKARSISCEIHAGFHALRKHLPFQLEENPMTDALPPEVQNEVQRTLAICRECRQQHNTEGPFLFGRFSIADAMLAPIMVRFLMHHVELPLYAADYAAALMALPEMQMWCHDV